MFVILLAFFGTAFGWAGMEMMLKRGEASVIGIILCFLSLVMGLKALTRLVLWLASLERPRPS